MSKIYIGYTHNDEPTGVLLSKNQEQAEIVWAAMNDMPHRIEEIDPNEENLGLHGVVFLLTSFERREDGKNFREWKRGR
jgi:hypothetical protein